MSFYQTFPHHNKPKKWICQCGAKNEPQALECSECFVEREDGIISDTECSCPDFPGDDLRCPVHGVTVEIKQ